ncbi:hypothetical protein BXZ70DRAFT_688306 [Cristinia sonorae]|uniref:Uncharacterized protein n=1 Tax=Cristinia sonorae TaxID=1940300 RepID=A0A8K0XJW5_9AGAR|nr:hypothetical protein BXZ70DRAFT_688306 [Cristinia sonorae]
MNRPHKGAVSVHPLHRKRRKRRNKRPRTRGCHPESSCTPFRQRKSQDDITASTRVVTSRRKRQISSRYPAPHLLSTPSKAKTLQSPVPPRVRFSLLSSPDFIVAPRSSLTACEPPETSLPPPTRITSAHEDPFVDSPSSYFELSSPESSSSASPPATPPPPELLRYLQDPIVWDTPVAHSTPKRRPPPRRYDPPTSECEWFLSREQLFAKQQSESGPSVPREPPITEVRVAREPDHCAPLYDEQSRPRTSWEPVRGLSSPASWIFGYHVKRPRD